MQLMKNIHVSATAAKGANGVTGASRGCCTAAVQWRNNSVFEPRARSTDRTGALKKCAMLHLSDDNTPITTVPALRDDFAKSPYRNYVTINGIIAIRIVDTNSVLRDLGIKMKNFVGENGKELENIVRRARFERDLFLWHLPATPKAAPSTWVLLKPGVDVDMFREKSWFELERAMRFTMMNMLKLQSLDSLLDVWRNSFVEESARGPFVNHQMSIVDAVKSIKSSASTVLASPKIDDSVQFPPLPGTKIAVTTPAAEAQPAHEETAAAAEAQPAHEETAAAADAQPAYEEIAADAQPAYEETAADADAQPAYEEIAADAQPAYEETAADADAQPAYEEIAADAQPAYEETAAEAETYYGVPAYAESYYGFPEALPVVLPPPATAPVPVPAAAPVPVPAAAPVPAAPAPTAAVPTMQVPLKMLPAFADPSKQRAHNIAYARYLEHLQHVYTMTIKAHTDYMTSYHGLLSSSVEKNIDV